MSTTEAVFFGVLLVAVGFELNKIKVDILELKGSSGVCLKCLNQM